MIRLGHLGWVHEPEINEALDALAAALTDLGYTLPAVTHSLAAPVEG
jgi:aspartate aminotransferase-like enzyme